LPTPNPKAGHSYARKYPGHESVNFKFDKKGIDTNEKVHGFVQWKYPPKFFIDGGVVVFYSQNTESKTGEIVGIYCNTQILKNKQLFNYKGFEDDILSSNLIADKSISMLFPIPLLANNYKKQNQKRIAGQIGYTYYDLELAEKIIQDEIIAIKNSGFKINEFEKLKKIYKFISGKSFDDDILTDDYTEQSELVEIYSAKDDRNLIISELVNLTEKEQELVTISSKTYKRDNKTIAQLKILRGFKCQICGMNIIIKNNKRYIEAAHIKPKKDKGCETPDNIMILCPNHHKEFDLGDVTILNHTKDSLVFVMNGTQYKINLEIK